MKRKFLNLLVSTALMLSANSSFAQYPNIPADVKKSSDSMMKEAYHQSDIAWEKAKPIIAKEAAEGKPYIPWAGRPNDLPQSELLAFPGAEGGGAYSFGGHGGRVIVVKNLNDSGPGSLRDACEQGGARIVVFNVAGIIKLKTPLI
ncbi:MAG: polysaccharide lyase, partial [Sphingobacteriaceae bacterium]